MAKNTKSKNTKSKKTHNAKTGSTKTKNSGMVAFIAIPLILIVVGALGFWFFSAKGGNNVNPVVTIKMDNGKEIQVELYPEIAPNTVNNFIFLVKSGFYDGLIFHRVIPGFMIQGGDPNGNGMGGPGYSIKGEFTLNGFSNNLKHTRGVISMARSAHPDSAGSQFFIMVDNAPHLDGQYAAFGTVISGIEEVDRIVNVKRDYSDRPYDEQKMAKVTVDTKGKEYPAPEKLNY